MKGSTKPQWPMKICLALSVSLSLLMLIVHSGCTGGGANLTDVPEEEERSIVIARFSLSHDGEILRPATDGGKIKFRLREVGSPRTLTPRTDEKGYLFAAFKSGEYVLESVSFENPGGSGKTECLAKWEFTVPPKAVLYLGAYDLFVTGSTIEVVGIEEDETDRQAGMARAVQWGTKKHGPSPFRGRTMTTDESLIPDLPVLAVNEPNQEFEIVTWYFGWHGYNTLTTPQESVYEHVTPKDEEEPETFEFKINR